MPAPWSATTRLPQAPQARVTGAHGGGSSRSLLLVGRVTEDLREAVGPVGRHRALECVRALARRRLDAHRERVLTARTRRAVAVEAVDAAILGARAERAQD